MFLKTPKLKVDNVQDVQKQASFNSGVCVDSFCLLGQILLFFLRLMYYWSETIYRKIKPIPPVSVKGEIVLITGSGHGIGRELALAYAAKGATVVGWDINKKNNDDTVKEISESGSCPKAYSFQCDVTNRAEVLKVANEVKSKVGDVTILINNAGIMPCHLITDHSPEEIEKVIAINLTSHFWLLQAFLPKMKEKNYGHIVSLSSMAGIAGFANIVPYCATKFAVRGYMEALHEEFRLTNPNNRIKITCIYPYIVDTGLCKRPKIKYESLMPMLSPKDVAREILEAQINGKIEITIPSYLGGFVQWGRLLPYNAAMDLKDTFETTVEVDL